MRSGENTRSPWMPVYSQKYHTKRNLKVLLHIICMNIGTYISSQKVAYLDKYIQFLYCRNHSSANTIEQGEKSSRMVKLETLCVQLLQVIHWRWIYTVRNQILLWIISCFMQFIVLYVLFMRMMSKMYATLLQEPTTKCRKSPTRMVLVRHMTTLVPL